MVHLYKILFSSILISSSIISISALSWFSAWIGLEMNLLAIIPLMKSPKNNLSAEASIKYFIIQSMASSILLFSVILFSYMSLFSHPNKILGSIMNLALILKMGAAPLHFWLPEVISGLDWGLVFTMLTWQKISPMILLSYCLYSSMLLSVIIILSSLVSGILGMNQMCLRKMMAFSSINHMGWMMSALLSSMNLWLYYFLIYSFTNMNMLIMFNKFHLFYMNQLNKFLSFNKHLKFLFVLNLLSLGGLPPFMGFFPKWITVNYLITLNYHFLSIILVTLTLLTLFFYMRMSFSSLMLTSLESLANSQISKFSMWQFFFNLMNLASLPLCIFLVNFF
uniref:NADH-ubiquinone oxidoreductase chain 2 n=1 Tax=Trigonopterus tounensis TaxID=2896837 RepID=A0A7H1KHS7_9CUCU|nr:NADH dehydrogenase subunit 2 [Trigonopterus tounensis]